MAILYTLPSPDVYLDLYRTSIPFYFKRNFNFLSSQWLILKILMLWKLACYLYCFFFCQLSLLIFMKHGISCDPQDCVYTATRLNFVLVPFIFVVPYPCCIVFVFPSLGSFSFFFRSFSARSRCLSFVIWERSSLFIRGNKTHYTYT